MELLVETVKGFEEICKNELKQISDSVEIIKEMEGYLLIEGELEDVFRLNYSSGTSNRIIHVLDHFKIEEPEDCYENLDFEVEEFIEPDQKFVVRVEKYVDDFKSTSLARESGQKIVDSYSEEKGETLSVDLEEPDIVFRLYVFDEKTFFGFDTTGKPLNDRAYLEKEVEVPPILANCLVRYSEWEGEEKMMDPFARDGVVAVEAARIVSNTPNKGRKFGFIDSKFYSNRAYSEIARKINEKMLVEETNIKACEKDVSTIEKHAESASVNIEIDDTTALENKLDGYHIVFDTPYIPRKSKRKQISRYMKDFEEKISSSDIKSLACTSRSEKFFEIFERKNKVEMESFKAYLFSF